ncbi:MAG: hypothetical protein ACJASK_002382, partial [Ilumatobacter sp.]
MDLTDQFEPQLETQLELALRVADAADAF